MTDLPTVITSAGLQPQSPATIHDQLIALVIADRPGYTANLPLSLIEDISSTDVAAISLIDAARVEAVNCLNPLAANAYLLSQLGQIYIGPGSAPGVPTNTSVYVVFEAVDKDENPLPGQIIAEGFTVSDGVYQYVVQDGGATGADGFAQPLFCIATVPGSWAVPTNSVTALISAAPPGVTLTCTNQTAGVSGAAAETEAEYRVRVLRAGQAISQGMATMLKTLVAEVPGVQARLISVKQQAGGGWEVIVGGGDHYQVAYAIYASLFDVSTLVGSTTRVTAITQAANGQVTTDINHGYQNGQVAVINGALGMTAINGLPLTVTVVNEKSFTTGVNTSGFGGYTGGGIVTPNFRNVTIAISDYPDIYSIPFVDPPQQVVVVSLLWGTSDANFISDSAIAQLGNPALVAYINSIPVGAPINLYELQTTFQEAVATVLEPQLLTRMAFSVSINGIGVPPISGTGLIEGDPESYFLTTPAQVVIARG